jgi:adenosylcobyric acid synthase
MPAKHRPLMVLGTGSHVGKSVVTAGLCRVFKRRGIRVAPFKAQNMALNSGITPDGLEMGRAQITQAEAAGLAPQIDMNPILLKPTSQVGSQVVLMGKALGNYAGADYHKLKSRLVRQVMAAFRRLRDEYDLVVMEGAGSCAEMNLKKHDLVNLPMARRAGAHCVLVADIDAGGVFAQVAGTMSLLTPTERKMITGFVINKFRGDPKLFQDGVAWLEKRTKKPVLGVLPKFEHIQLPQEDGVALERGELKGPSGLVRIGVVRLSHISNYTDADCLAAESEAVSLRWVERPEELAGLDLLILPGSKNTLAALAGLKKSGLFEAIRSYHALGGRVLGLCGGYQLLGLSVADPQGVEGPPAVEDALGLLPVRTVMAGEKTTALVEAQCQAALPFAATGPVRGYEIHMGETTAQGASRPAFWLTKRVDQAVSLDDGQISPDGRVVGTYLHGILDNDDLRAALLAWAGGGAVAPSADYAVFKNKQYDLLADLLEVNLNLGPLLKPAS